MEAPAPLVVDYRLVLQRCLFEKGCRLGQLCSGGAARRYSVGTTWMCPCMYAGCVCGEKFLGQSRCDMQVDADDKVSLTAPWPRVFTGSVMGPQKAHIGPWSCVFNKSSRGTCGAAARARSRRCKSIYLSTCSASLEFVLVCVYISLSACPCGLVPRARR